MLFGWCAFNDLVLETEHPKVKERIKGSIYMNPKVIQHVFRLSGEDYHKKFLEVVNSILPLKLTSMEINVLSYCLENSKEGSFTSEIKDGLKEVYSFTSASLSGHLKRLSDKYVLFKVGDTYHIKSFLIPNESFQGFQIKIENEGNNKG